MEKEEAIRKERTEEDDENGHEALQLLVEGEEDGHSADAHFLSRLHHLEPIHWRRVALRYERWNETDKQTDTERSEDDITHLKTQMKRRTVSLQGAGSRCALFRHILQQHVLQNNTQRTHIH